MPPSERRRHQSSLALIEALAALRAPSEAPLSLKSLREQAGQVWRMRGAPEAVSHLKQEDRAALVDWLVAMRIPSGAAPPEGPWTLAALYLDRFGLQDASGGTRFTGTEDEVREVRDALNRLAARFG